MQTLAENKKAFFDYEILEKYQAGIVLTGQEVKSIKGGRISLAGSFVVLKDSEVFLLNADVPPYQPNNLREEYNQKRSRKLLLQKSEINELIGKSRQKGLTMVPLRVYNHKSKIKVEFAIVKGKRKVDKREKIKNREADREIERTIKGGATA
ncbi:MAG: SsrA-binding protein SmpB [Candidatus Pacebacteria bacterium]|nr:SsrA-binding protein SmpB [Candidatus Paceibacterota bacterium]